MPHDQQTVRQAISGLAGGAAATVPMTAAMFAVDRLLPPSEHEPQEPRQVTEGVLQLLGVADRLSEPQKLALTTAAHFGYGAFLGAVYQLSARRTPLPPTLRGATFALAVWAAGYAGWIPALGILPPPQRRPQGRNLLLIVAHLVWGISAEKTLRALPTAAPPASRNHIRPKSTNDQAPMAAAEPRRARSIGQ